MQHDASPDPASGSLAAAGSPDTGPDDASPDAAAGFQPVKLAKGTPARRAASDAATSDASEPRPMGRPAREAPCAFMPVADADATYQRPDDFDRLIARIALVQRRHMICDTRMSTLLFAKNSKLGELRRGECGINFDTLRRCHERLDGVERQAQKGRTGWRRNAALRDVRVRDDVGGSSGGLHGDKFNDGGGGSQAAA